MPFTHRRVANTVGIVLTLVALVSLIFSWQASSKERKSNEQLKTYVQCQADWTNFLYQAIISARSSSTQSAAALDDLINTISTSTSREQSTAALDRYKKARAEQVKSQHDNPLPPAPKTVCQLEG